MTATVLHESWGHFLHTVISYFNVHWQLVSLLRDGPLYCFCLLTEPHEAMNQSMDTGGQWIKVMVFRAFSHWASEVGIWCVAVKVLAEKCFGPVGHIAYFKAKQCSREARFLSVNFASADHGTKQSQRLPPISHLNKQEKSPPSTSNNKASSRPAPLFPAYPSPQTTHLPWSRKASACHAGARRPSAGRCWCPWRVGSVSPGSLQEEGEGPVTPRAQVALEIAEKGSTTVVVLINRGGVDKVSGGARALTRPPNTVSLVNKSAVEYICFCSLFTVRGVWNKITITLKGVVVEKWLSTTVLQNRKARLRRLVSLFVLPSSYSIISL